MKFDVKENRTSRNQNFAENKSLSDRFVKTKAEAAGRPVSVG